MMRITNTAKLRVSKMLPNYADWNAGHPLAFHWICETRDDYEIVGLIRNGKIEVECWRIMGPMFYPAKTEEFGLTPNELKKFNDFVENWL